MRRPAVAVLLAALAVTATWLTACGAGAQQREPPPRMHVLVTNDDGVRAPGIDALVRALRAHGGVRVTVVAPAVNQSGTGGATTAGPLRAARSATRSGVPAWAVHGYPADAVRFALDTVLAGDPPDVVIAGINEGANLSPVYDHSGTVGAARAAAQRGLPALATSQGRIGRGVRTRFRDGVRLTLRWLDAHRDRLRPGTATSLNTPGCSRGRVRAMVPARPAPAGTPRPPRRAVDCTRRRTAFADDVQAFSRGFAPVARLPLRPAR